MLFNIGLLVKSILDGTFSVYSQVENFENLDRNEKEAYILNLLINQIQFCYHHVPFYRKRWDDYGVNLRQIQTNLDIVKFPILTKDDVRKAGSALNSDEIGRLKVVTRRSGGTTGEPIEAKIDRIAAAYETFSYFKGLHRMGWNSEMTTVRFFGGSLGVKGNPSLRSQIYQRLTNSVIIPAFSISRENINHYQNMIVKKKNLCLIGYPSAIYEFTEQLIKADLGIPKVKLIITTSEQLILDWELRLREVYQCPIRSYYGCGEVQSVGFQLFQGDNSYSIPEMQDFAESDSENNIILTHLHNRARPYIRYQNGDSGIVKGDLGEKKIVSLAGRTADFFYRKTGEKVSPVFGTHSIFQSGIPVEKYQYVQLTSGEIEFRYKMDRALIESEKEKIVSIVNLVMKEETIVVFEQNKAFEVSSSGKHRICVSYKILMA